ncbi:Nck-associated protein 5 [Nibea albiflora]|uniref:Nck-associated protein 5 n=1 Tax=Nibea albiflora TaxID=240163 RepID=A0ACB7EG56_NIBAL|nr:Nck-associated protein 5 [Nibea albiflora]
MEETVRTLLQNQDSLEGPKVDPLDLMKAYKDKLLEEMWKQQDSLEGPTATAVEMPASPEAGGGSEENSKDSNPLLERLRALEAENSALSMENDNQRKQYERCLDEVANQVVQALLTQKVCLCLCSIEASLIQSAIRISQRNDDCHNDE